MIRTKTFSIGLGCVLMAACSVSAATITAFKTYTNFGTIPTSPLFPTFSGSTASLNDATISCLSDRACSATAFALTLGATGYDPTQIISVSLGGNLSGTASGSGSLSFGGNLPGSTSTFSIAAGDFTTTIANITEPITGYFGDLGFFSVSLAPHQVLTLTDGLIFTFAPSLASTSLSAPLASTPEPGSMAMLGTGVAGLVFLIRRRL